MKKCLVISGGDFFDAPRSLYDEADFIVACDKGYEYSQKLGFTPDTIIGDFDSCKNTPEERKSDDKKNSPEIIRLSKDKDDSDTMAGVKHAIEKGCDDFTFICSDGGRFDHFFCNIQTLSYVAKKFHKARLISKNEEIIVISDSEIEIPRKYGWSLSVFSFCDEARGITEKGTRWQLNDAVMNNSVPYGLSNEWTSDKAVISVEEGTLIIILSKM